MGRKPIVEIDSLGRRLEIDAFPRRIVSLVPSLTETLFDLDLGAFVVGVTDFCIFPDLPSGVRRVGGTKSPKIELIRALEPDLVYVNVEENLRRHADAIEAFAPVFATEPASVDDVRDLIARLGRIHDRSTRGEEWIGRIDAMRESLREPSFSFRFACPIWKDPWMWCGGDTYVSDLVTSAGGTNILSGRTRYPKLPLEEVLAMAPDLLFLPDEPYEFGERERNHLREIGFANVVGPFPGHLFTWHGTRTALGLEYLHGVVERVRAAGEVPANQT